MFFIHLQVCAPTGAGKTNIAMIAILHEVRNQLAYLGSSITLGFIFSSYFIYFEVKMKNFAIWFCEDVVYSNFPYGRGYMTLKALERLLHLILYGHLFCHFVFIDIHIAFLIYTYI